MSKTLCEEKLNIYLPAKPPFHPQQFHTCAIVGNSGDLLKIEFRGEIDSHDVIFPINEKYAKYIGHKRDFLLVVRGVTRNKVPILNGSDDEVLIIKSRTHKEINVVAILVKEQPMFSRTKEQNLLFAGLELPLAQS
ncbi:Sialyltransferase-like protein 5, partial [Mucuna pruriens]